MKKKRKSRTCTPRSSGADFNDLLIQAGRTGIALAGKALSIAEKVAHKRKLFKSYPYLSEAFKNVEGVITFLRSSLSPHEPEVIRRHERTKRQKGHKKIPKPKTL